MLAKLTFSTIVSCPTLRIGPYLFYIAKIVTEFKTTEKLIGHRTRFRVLPMRGSAAKKKPPIFNARALMTREILRSRDAQCNTGELNNGLFKTLMCSTLESIKGFTTDQISHALGSNIVDPSSSTKKFSSIEKR